MQILIGSDPEVFIRHVPTGHFVSAHGMFPGTKEEPFALGNQGFMQVDGHALEFNTAPAATEEEFVSNVITVFNLIKEEVRKVNPDFEIALEPVATFEDEYFAMLPDSAKMLGCDPDFSGIDGQVLSPPDIKDLPVRTGSGHIHVGWTKFDECFDPDEFKKRLHLANRMTPYLLEASKKWENEASAKRREYYGREFSFRPKHYGVELRALDNLWLKSEETIREVYRVTVAAFNKEFLQNAS